MANTLRTKLVKGVKKPITNRAPNMISVNGIINPIIKDKFSAKISNDFTYSIYPSISITFIVPEIRNMNPIVILIRKSPNEELPRALKIIPIINFSFLNLLNQLMNSIYINQYI
jgi:hypothetical protein